MKKMAVMAIGVLLFGFGYANAQQTFSNMGGHFTNLNLKVIYEQEVPATNTLKEGDKFVTKATGIKAGSQYDPVLYLKVDPDQGNPIELDVFWHHPANGQRILALSCPFPTIISTKPEDSIAKPPATETRQIQGLATCDFCPDGINPNNLPLSGCNSGQPSNTGEPTPIGYLSFKGTVVKDMTTKQATSATFKGTVGGGGFNYAGTADWASPDCTIYPPTPNDYVCQGVLTGTFGATLTPCPVNDPQCQNL